MMGVKNRVFHPLPRDVPLEDLVPEESFYRRLEEQLDLSFVRELGRPSYAKGGRPSVDPVVLFKLRLVMFFEGLRSERQLMRAAADRLSVRWYLGYDLFEPPPNHSNLTRARQRFGLSVPGSTWPEGKPQKPLSARLASSARPHRSNTTLATPAFTPSGQGKTDLFHRHDGPIEVRDRRLVLPDRLALSERAEGAG